jgi:hypothetical protein
MYCGVAEPVNSSQKSLDVGEKGVYSFGLLHGNYDMRCFTNIASVLLNGKLLVLAAFWLVATPGLSAPVLVDTSAGTFYVDLLPLDSFDNLTDTLDDQVWWGDTGLASEFANAVGESLGLPNFPSSPTLGPLFATSGPNAGGNSVGCYWVGSADVVSCNPFTSTTTPAYHAFAVLANPPVILVQDGFFKLDTLGGGVPADLHCSEPSHYGRMTFDEDSDLLYICDDSGWITK